MNSVFSHVKKYEILLLHLHIFLTKGKRYGRKRLSDEHAEDDDDDAQQSEVGGSKSPSELLDLSLPPKMPLIQPKTEPEEQESKWTNSWTCSSIFPFFMTQFWLRSDLILSLVFAVHVKVEEVEMEIPSISKQVQQEEGREPSTSGQHDTPAKNSLENEAHVMTEKIKAATHGLEEPGSTEVSFRVQSDRERQILDQEERSQENDRPMDEVLESSTKRLRLEEWRDEEFVEKMETQRRP